MLTYRDFLRARTSFRASINLELSFMDMCGGDPAAALVLSHVVDLSAVFSGTDTFWPMPEVEVLGATRLGRKRCRTAIRKLKRLGLIQTKVKCFKGTITRALHVRVEEGVFLAAWKKVKADPRVM